MSTWTRIELTARTVELTGGLEARIADPLWLLARQWQVGEFHGDDAAQPTAAQVTFRSAPVDLPAAPLEAVIEAAPEPSRGAAGLHATVRAGRRLMRLLELADLGAARALLCAAYQPSAPAEPVSMPPLGPARCALMVRYGLDGRAVAAATPQALAAVLAPVDGAERDTALALIADWAAGYRAEAAGDTTGAWDGQRLEYAFEVTARPALASVTLHAPEHDGGHLDWYSFDLTGAPAEQLRAGVAGVAPPASPSRVVAAIPAPVRYNGMPASRWFEFEDGRVNFGDLDAGPADIARLLVAEFATSYSDDWFLLPLRLGVGTLTEVSSLRVVDNFGGSTVIGSVALHDQGRFGAARPWRLFELAGDVVSDSHPAPWLFLAPCVAGDLTGPAVERVVLARDEAANLVWGIEQLVEGPAGRGVQRSSAWPAGSPTPASTTSDDELWHYRLETTAPPWWIPFVPERVSSDSPQVRLRRARMQSWELLGRGPVGPQSELLDPQRPVWLYEEEVPATGVVVERRWRFARWHDGSTHLWSQRAKRPAAGNRSSGVRWDPIPELAQRGQ